MIITGQVRRQRVAPGSKSDRIAIVLVAGNHEYILRRVHGDPFHDEVLEALVGQHVSCEGVALAGSTFQARTIVPIKA